MRVRAGVRTVERDLEGSGTVLGKQAKDGESPVHETRDRSRQDPKYVETRETLTEGRGTTP